MEEGPGLSGSGGNIQRLDKEVVNRIAAGEVIQRPVSAVKEMLENSLDAGADAVTVTCKEGGIKMLQIQDTGKGIKRADLGIVCERFTTSKLRKFEDLHSIATFGFRGEALASISHVAHVTITTMTPNSPCAFRASYSDSKLVPSKPGEPAEPKACAGVPGTTITVEDLFFNVPTRRQALRSASEEYKLILECVTRYAIHYSGVSFICKKYGQSAADVHTAKNATIEDNIRSLFGSSVGRELLPIQAECSELGVKLMGRITNANYSHKRGIFILFINGRLVESSNLKRTLEAVYANYLPKNGHPFMYLSLDIAADRVDVNVHPTKKEVHFSNEEEVLELAQNTIEEALLSCNSSRSFYTQTLLPGMGASASSSSGSSSQGAPAVGASQSSDKTRGLDFVYPHQLVRVTDKSQVGQMELYVSAGGENGESSASELGKRHAEEGKGMTGEGTDQPPPKKPLNAEGYRLSQQEVVLEDMEVDGEGVGETSLDSVRDLVQDIKASSHDGLRHVFRKHVFVGLVNSQVSVIQHQTRLYLLNMSTVSKHLFQQMCLKKMSQVRSQLIELNPRLDLVPLIRAGLDSEVAGFREEEHGDKDAMAKFFADTLMSKREVLTLYFGIILSEHGELCALPQLVQGYVPPMHRLPLFLLRLVTEVEWDFERECMESISREIAAFYALPEVEGWTEEDTSHHGDLPEAPKAPFGGGGALSFLMQHALLPACRLYLDPPPSMAQDGSVLEIARLEDLYKVFERC